MFDLFYSGTKPNLFVFEKPATSLEDAANQSRTEFFWFVSGNNDFTGFDFNYVPPPWEENYIQTWGNQWLVDGNVYLAKCSNNGNYQFHGSPKVHLLPDPTSWCVPDNVDKSTVDFRWAPNPKSPPYIYHFPSQWQSASGVTYTVPGATEIKIVDAFVVTALNNIDSFETLIPVDKFDYSWHPNPLDPPYNYVFGNQWNPGVLEPTVVYRVIGAVEDKFTDEMIATVAQDLTQWELLDDIVDFDYSWRPNPKDPPYVYVFGNQWLTPEMRPALTYRAIGATEIKYMDNPKAHRNGDPDKFKSLYDSKFDWSWEPDPGSPPYNYIFGNQWYPAEVMPTIEYNMPGATEHKFMDTPQAKLAELHDQHWHTLIKCKWDYSWRPEPGSPPYIYVFGNQWHSAAVMPTVEYHMTGATERKFMDAIPATILPNAALWVVPEEVDVSNIDFSWVPDPGEPLYIYHFGTEYQVSVGLTYAMPGAVELKFAGPIPRIQKEKAVVEALNIFFVDRGNPTAQARFNRLAERYPNVQKVRYANSIMDTIKRCITRTKTTKFWVISSEYSYDEFDFTWHAQPWQSYMTHVFPSQHQKYSDTFLINKYEFERHAKWAKGIEEFPNLNFVKDLQVYKPENLYDIYYVDHSNPQSANQLVTLRSTYPDMVVTRFVDNYLDTFKRIMATAQTEYVWITSSLCDYANFDFTWQPEPWQNEMIHCFSNRYGDEKRGDTFYIHVASFKTQMIDLIMLDWFNVINYLDGNIFRFVSPVHYYDTDNLVEEIKNYNFVTPYVVFTNYRQMPPQRQTDICLWTKKDRVVAPMSHSKATVLVPRDIKADLKTQIYDYPYLADRQINSFATERPLDIIYISNGEPDEQKWFTHTEYMSNRPVKWIQGINGRAAAYKAAAEASDTPWFLAVFAKLEVPSSGFNWDWQPDYFQEPKHYIFNAKNPLNGLEYGHQGMIAYNRKLVLETTESGLDFTLSKAHEVVPILSGVAHFNQDPWMTWRTAFREVAKLKHFSVTQPNVETDYRLKVWLTKANGLNAEWCLRGAADAVEFYDSIGGDYTKLMLTFEWDWLRKYFDTKY